MVNVLLLVRERVGLYSTTVVKIFRQMWIPV